MPSKKPYVTMIFEPDLFEWIEDFRFEHRFPTRTAAIMWLLEWARDQNPQPPAPKDRVAAGD